MGDSGNHTVREIDTGTGAVRTIAGSPGTNGALDGIGAAATFEGPAALTYDGNGNLYLVDAETIRKLVVATGAVTTIAGQTGVKGNLDAPDGGLSWFNDPGGLTADGAGNLYVADTQNESIRQVSVATGAVTTLAGHYPNQQTTDGIGRYAYFDLPSGVVWDGIGHLYVAEYGGNTIREVDVSTRSVTTIAGVPATFGQADGPGATATFRQPWGIGFDGIGSLFVTELGNDTIREVSVATPSVATLAGTAGAIGSMDGTGPLASFSSPTAVDDDGAGALFVADMGNSTIRKIDASTGVVTTFAGKPASNGSTDGVGSAASFYGPEGLAYDGAGKLFVADRFNNVIREVDTDTGAVTTLAGSGLPGSMNGVGTSASFTFPASPIYDGAGTLYVADSGNATIRKVAVATRLVTTYAGNMRDSGARDGTITTALFGEPWGLAYDNAGTIFVADTGNDTIREIAVATGMVTTLAGKAGSPGHADGIGTAATFDQPRALALDGAGNLYVTDLYNYTIRKIVVATGTVTTLAGTVGVFGSVDGVGTAARFNGPVALVYDGAGNLLVADEGSHAIRKVAIATGAVTTVIGVLGQAGVELGALPASLNMPAGLALTPGGDLFISDFEENAILVAH